MLWPERPLTIDEHAAMVATWQRAIASAGGVKAYQTANGWLAPNPQIHWGWVGG